MFLGIMIWRLPRKNLAWIPFILQFFGTRISLWKRLQVFPSAWNSPENLTSPWLLTSTFRWSFLNPTRIQTNKKKRNINRSFSNLLWRKTNHSSNPKKKKCRVGGYLEGVEPKECPCLPSFPIRRRVRILCRNAMAQQLDQLWHPLIEFSLLLFFSLFRKMVVMPSCRLNENANTDLSPFMHKDHETWKLQEAMRGILFRSFLFFWVSSKLKENLLFCVLEFWVAFSTSLGYLPSCQTLNSYSIYS